ncbi:hypothetical protein GCM10012285_10200 [Streptomyces kronopolitis]|uniref:ATP-binding protein n=1 Tax=Streptomyces kronopolitis TaxID=1612435 RepID=A0ABQ2J1J5_9ACTN|nr:hypothetical protein [Streptomyces kronopolitis]GGN36440.1 hypothetical protein GCM10012285_10200 [Streptomyces kronopolitis]
MGSTVATTEFAVPESVPGALGDLAVDRPLALNGVLHLVGLMNSGKSTLMDLLTVLAVRRGLRGGYLLASVADVYAKAAFLRALGIKAVPQIGRSNRSEHVAAYWGTTLHDQDTHLPRYADGAARYTVDLRPPINWSTASLWRRRAGRAEAGSWSLASAACRTARCRPAARATMICTTSPTPRSS